MEGTKPNQKQLHGVQSVGASQWLQPQLLFSQFIYWYFIALRFLWHGLSYPLWCWKPKASIVVACLLLNPLDF